MAGVTIVGGIRMVAGFTLRNGVVVATDAGANYLVVIQRCNERRPVRWRHAMAGFTVIRGIGMIAGLALRNGTVVATETGANYFVMI